jgi:hypothetical protein
MAERSCDSGHQCSTRFAHALQQRCSIHQGRRSLFNGWGMLKLGASPLPNRPLPADSLTKMMTALDERGAIGHPTSYLTSVTSTAVLIYLPPKSDRFFKCSTLPTPSHRQERYHQVPVQEHGQTVQIRRCIGTVVFKSCSSSGDGGDDEARAAWSAHYPPTALSAERHCASLGYSLCCGGKARNSSQVRNRCATS